MGNGIGILCERCGEQISYDNQPFITKEDGYKHDICGKCMKERHKRNWDEEHQYE